MKQIVIRMPDHIFEELNEGAKRSGQSINKTALTYFHKNSLVGLFSDETKLALSEVVDALTRLERKNDMRLMQIAEKLDADSSRNTNPFSQNSGPDLSRKAILLIASVMVEVNAVREDKHRVKAIKERVDANEKDPAALEELLMELGKLLPSDKMGDLWKNTLKFGAEKIRKGE